MGDSSVCDAGKRVNRASVTTAVSGTSQWCEKSIDALPVICEADKERLRHVARRAQVGKCSIVVPAAGAEALAMRAERDDRHQHEIEPASLARVHAAALRFRECRNAVVAQRFGQRNETHRAGAMRSNQRHEQFTTALARERDRSAPCRARHARRGRSRHAFPGATGECSSIDRVPRARPAGVPPRCGPAAAAAWRGACHRASMMQERSAEKG